MSATQTFRFPWEELHEKKLAAIVAKVVRDFEGVVATKTPDEVDPDRDEYVRPGFEEEEEEEEDATTWYFGFPSAQKSSNEKYAWASVHFHEDDDEDEPCCSGWFDGVDPRCEDAFLDLVAELVEQLDGTMDEI